MKRILSLFLAFLFCFSAFSAAGVTAEGDTLKAGQLWRHSWTAEDRYTQVILEAAETGFYRITVNDHMQTGYFYIEIYDVTSEPEYAGYIAPWEILDSYVSNDIFLAEGHKYQLVIEYGKFTDTEYNICADMSLSFGKSTASMQAIPSGTLTSTDLFYDFEEGVTAYFSYKTGDEGNYSLYINDLYAYVTVYKASTGETVAPGTTATEFLSYFYGGIHRLREAVNFTLEADTRYYFAIEPYASSVSQLAASHNGKGVSYIAPNEPSNSFGSFIHIDPSQFTYTLTHTDGTTSFIPNAEELQLMGYKVPDIRMKNGYVEINEKYYLYAGDEKVISTYNGISTTITVDVESLAEQYSYLTPTKENDVFRIQYESDERFCRWLRVNVSRSGYYSIYHSLPNELSSVFDVYSVVLIDDKNNIVSFNSTDGAWYLNAGAEYVISFLYRYASDNTSVDFWLEERMDLRNGWAWEGGKWYYYQNGNKASSCWRKDSVGWVYLGSDGAMATNCWVRDSVGWCYVGADGYAVTNCWKKDSVGWCYLGSNGSQVFSRWIYDSGKWYYVGADGYMASSCWMKDSVGWVYLGSNGAMVTNKWVRDSVGWCYVGSDGYAVTNCWMADSVGWCYLDENGSQVISAWVKDGGKWYYIASDGYMLYSTSKRINGKTYYFNASGVCTNR